MNWLIGQLFGSQAAANLSDKIKALVGSYLVANPSINQATVTQLVNAEADKLVAQVLVHFPGWAVEILTELLNSQITKLTTSAFNSLTSLVGAQAASS